MIRYATGFRVEGVRVRFFYGSTTALAPAGRTAEDAEVRAVANRPLANPQWSDDRWLTVFGALLLSR